MAGMLARAEEPMGMGASGVLVPEGGKLRPFCVPMSRPPVVMFSPDVVHSTICVPLADTSTLPEAGEYRPVVALNELAGLGTVAEVPRSMPAMAPPVVRVVQAPAI